MTPGFTWHQSSDQQYEAREGDTVIATLSRHGASGTHATGQTPRGSVTLRRTGAFRTRVAVANAEDGREIAVVAKDGKALTVRLDAGGTFVWTSAHAEPKGSHAFVDPDGQDVLVFTRARGGSRAHGTVIPAEPTLTDPTSSVLLVLGLFLIALQQSDDDATLIGALAAVTVIT
jgi:hypothetical protein